MVQEASARCEKDLLTSSRVIRLGSKKSQQELLRQSLESPSIACRLEDVGEEDMEVIESEDFAARKPEAAAVRDQRPDIWMCLSSPGARPLCPKERHGTQG